MLDFGMAIALLARGDVALGESEIIENAFGVGPLLEQIVVLEEMVVAETGMRHDDGLHRHGIFLEQIRNAGIGIDHHLVGEALEAVLVERLLAGEQFAERPVRYISGMPSAE